MSRLVIVLLSFTFLSCSQREVVRSEPTTGSGDSLEAAHGYPGDIDFSQVSGFVIKGKTGGKVLLRALNKSGVEFGQVFAVDESEIEMFGVAARKSHK